jgi:putative hydrolase of the HAD superfamily
MMPAKIRAIFFDAGNTLLYPRLEEIAQALTGIGFPAEVEDFCEAERAGKRALDDWLWPQIRSGQIPKVIDPYYWRAYLEFLTQRVGVPEEKQAEVMQWISGHFRNIETWSRVLPEIPSSLAELQAAGYFLGVISNSVGTVEQQLGRAGLGGYFSTVLDSAVVGVEKPNREIFHMALDRAQVEASEAVFIGDTYSTDIGGARLAGLRGILIDRVGAYPEAECPRVQSLRELAKYL